MADVYDPLISEQAYKLAVFDYDNPCFLTGIYLLVRKHAGAEIVRKRKASMVAICSH